MKKLLIAVLISLVACLASYSGAFAFVDDIPAGSLSTWTYAPNDPCGGTRVWQETTSPFDGTTAIEAYMGGCGWTCGSYTLNKDYTFETPLDRNSTIIRFDGQFDRLGSLSHNRAQIYFQFYREGTYIGYVLYGYGTIATNPNYSNVPPGLFASGNWEFGLSSLSEDPDTIRVVLHPRSCNADGMVTFDNLEVITQASSDCGDGVVDEGEECDDGNNDNGDGCSSECTIEPYCGDGNLDPTEECDDGNNDNGDGCDANCNIEDPDPCEVLGGDTDGDGVCDADDNCPNDASNDADGDGVCSSDGDCDDNDENQFPGNTEVCDGLDNDCDGATDEGYITTPTTCGVGECSATGATTCQGGVEGDTCTPGTPVAEVCDNLDNDCDGSTDEELTVDVDGDGHSTPNSCEGTKDDCDDSDALNFPGNTEVCDGQDNNCNGSVDDGLYVFGGFQQPININGSSIFKAGRTIPVKITLTDCNGSNISTAVVTITVHKITDTVLGTQEELNVEASGNANTGNLFRYVDSKYIFNLSTKGYSSGTYIVYAQSDDGTSTSVMFSLK